MSKTHLIIVLDKSNSMLSRKSEAIDAVNSLIGRYDRSKTMYSLIKFAKEVEVLVARRPFGQFVPLYEWNYEHLSGTALYEAITEAIRLGDSNMVDGERIEVKIITDGMNNAGRRECTKQVVTSVMDERTSRGNWKFEYIGQQLTYERSTHIIVILDESPSMRKQTAEVIRSYNEFLATQKRIVRDVGRFSLIKFNHLVNVLYVDQLIETAQDLDNTTYYPNGNNGRRNTALYDAIYKGIQVGDERRRSAERVLCLILTDGGENASRYARASKIKRLMEERKARGNWTFVYIGTEPSRIAQDFGVADGNVAEYNHQSAVANFQLASSACVLYRKSDDLQSGTFFAVRRVN